MSFTFKKECITEILFYFKGTMSRDFLLLVQGDRVIFRKFSEIFASQDASPVSTTTAAYLPPIPLVSLITVANLPPVGNNGNTPTSIVQTVCVLLFYSSFSSTSHQKKEAERASARQWEDKRAFLRERAKRTGGVVCT